MAPTSPASTPAPGDPAPDPAGAGQAPRAPRSLFESLGLTGPGGLDDGFEAIFETIRDRRQTPRRRLRDRIASLDRSDNPLLREQPALDNQLLLVDDELRQTALALGRVEAFLTTSMTLLESAGLTAGELAAHALDEAVLDDVEELADNLANLRRRMGSIATAMK